MSIIPDVELAALTANVLEELEIVIEDNPDAKEEDIVDWAYELADGWTPVYNFDVLELAANNLELIGYRDIPSGILSDVTPVTVARAAIFDYLKEILYAEWHGRLKLEKEEE